MKSPPPKEAAAPSRQYTEFYGWLCNYEGVDGDGLTGNAELLHLTEKLLEIGEPLNGVATLADLKRVYGEHRPLVIDPPLHRIWRVFETCTKPHDDGLGLMNGARVAFDALVPRFAKLMGQFGNEDTARSIMANDLIKARKVLSGPPEGRLAIAIEDMERRRSKGESFGDPAQRLYGFMKSVDPVKAKSRAETMHATPAPGVERTPEEVVDAYLATPGGQEALRYKPNLRTELIAKHRAKKSQFNHGGQHA